MSNASIRDFCASLGQQPLLHLSLHSKELFHSNFLGWLCDSHPAAASAALERWLPNAPSDQHTVLREQDNLDLAVKLPGRAPFVLENKVFSAPDEAQLDRYADGKLAGFKDPVLLLLSLGAPSWQDGTYLTKGETKRTWQYLSFSDLEEILGLVGEHLDAAPTFHRLLVEEYRTLVRTLAQLALVVGQPSADQPIHVPAEHLDDLRPIRLHDAIGKLRSRAAVAAAKTYTEALISGSDIAWEANFLSGSPLMSAFVAMDGSDKLGWQYQNGQWRLAVLTTEHKGKGAQMKQLREALVASKYASWFDFSAIPQLIGRDVSKLSPREASGGFNHYDPDFVYRYRKLPALTREELLTLSHHYLSKAVALRNGTPQT